MTTPQKPKICIDCRYCALQVNDYLCDRTKGETTNLVTGEPLKLHARPCSFERSGQGECKQEGRHWKAKG